MEWKRFEGPDIRGTLIMGDDSAPPTKWWNHLWLALWGWKTVVVFQVPREAIERGYRVGYRPFDGKTMLEEKPNYDKSFRMKVGREDCVFFAVMKTDSEATLTLVVRTDKRRPLPKRASPLTPTHPHSGTTTRDECVFCYPHPYLL